MNTKPNVKVMSDKGAFVGAKPGKGPGSDWDKLRMAQIRRNRDAGVFRSQNAEGQPRREAT